MVIFYLGVAYIVDAGTSLTKLDASLQLAQTDALSEAQA